MRIPDRQRLFRSIILAIMVLIYLIAIPGDLAALVDILGKVLSLSYAVSPWLYGVAAVATLAWTAGRIWGRVP